jgi:hypothetical protein
MKLIRATIPMCPNCGTKMEPVTGQHYLCCPGCDSTEIPDYGYYAPDIAGVVAEIRDTYDGSCVCDNCYPLEDKINDINGWADRLEGKP